MSDLRNIWINQSSNVSTEVIIKKKIDEVTELNCFVGTICMSQAKVFILELDNGFEVHQNYLKRFVGVEIQVLPAGDHSELVIILLENDLLDIFSYFIEDIINVLIPESDQSNALLKISDKINYWKRLFSKITGGILTSQQQRGLFGELYLLNELLENCQNKLYILNGWHGPSGANQDFWYNDLGVEVKTSKSNKPSIKISNEYQLEETDFNELYLIFYMLNEYIGGTETLYRLITKIRQSLDSESSKLFDEKLETLGINPDTEQEYNNTSFSVRSEKLYHVTQDFPKITKNNLQDALFSVSYEIEPLLCTAFEEDLSLIINRITNGNI